MGNPSMDLSSYVYDRSNPNDLEYTPTFLNDAQVAAAQAAIARGDVSSIKVHSDLEMNVQADWSVFGYAYSSTEITWLQLSTGELKTFNFSASTKCEYLSLTFSPARPELSLIHIRRCRRRG